MSSNLCVCCGVVIPEGRQVCTACVSKYGFPGEAREEITQKRVQREAEEQEALILWTRYNEARLPELALLFHIPNGGSRNKFEAKHLKAQGVKAGVPDLFLPAPRNGFHGLFIEMKAGKNKQTENQKVWAKRLIEQGYAFSVCYSWKEAAEKLEKYLQGGKNES